jgi:hypothetical protein
MKNIPVIGSFGTNPNNAADSEDDSNIFHPQARIVMRRQILPASILASARTGILPAADESRPYRGQ